MISVQFDSLFITKAANMEMNRANKACEELTHLMTIGYLNSQTGLDKAEEAKMHLVKARDLLARIDTPEVNATRNAIDATITAQDMIIRRIKFSMKLRELGLS